jgi:hypothetical protein
LARFVYVTNLSWAGGGTTSVHRSLRGAEKKLVKRAAELGIDLDLIDAGADTTNSYGLSYLRVEK